MGDSPDAHSKENLEAKEASPEQSAKEKPVGKAKEGKEKKGKEDKDDKGRTSIGLGLAAMGGQAKAAPRFAPTYRLEPKNPLRKERLEIIIKAEMDKNYNEEYTFHPKHSLLMAAQVSEDIKTRIKALNFDRYRYIVLITVGEFLMQGLYSLANFLWDAEKDGYVNYTIETPKFFAVCTVFYIYFD
ncbi:dynein light chain Tctex-type protein 2B-like [Drosophila sulfurigaster albostrigata]|uniref:dynein light chain Tctex-type protein 2B-like n=1 Tax=Drosophila sulfurigaster albostrigata TaxID=89887 RepID=UPI002D21D48C|nr:dynein light chain Tctex-type protein 2B-like [Drosophila sulfurigaster albostrigata]